MIECLACGRKYPSPLAAALCTDADRAEREDREHGTVYRSVA